MSGEAPQDAREVERRERWARALFGQTFGGKATWDIMDSDERGWMTAAMAEADREHADLVIERDLLRAVQAADEKRAEDAEAERDVAVRDLAQAVSERDTALDDCMSIRRALRGCTCATLDADAQDEVLTEDEAIRRGLVPPRPQGDE